MTSPLVIWCKTVLEGDFVLPIVPMLVSVQLMNENQIPIRAWSFANAYPVNWEVDGFNATKNEVAIETIQLAYTFSNRLV
jgi:phage tail-like protein